VLKVIVNSSIINSAPPHKAISDCAPIKGEARPHKAVADCAPKLQRKKKMGTPTSWLFGDAPDGRLLGTLTFGQLSGVR